MSVTACIRQHGRKQHQLRLLIQKKSGSRDILGPSQLTAGQELAQTIPLSWGGRAVTSEITAAWLAQLIWKHPLWRLPEAEQVFNTLWLWGS